MRENSVFALLASPNLGLAAKKAVSLFGASRSLPSVYTQIPYQFFLQDQSSYTDRNVFVEQHYISSSYTLLELLVCQNPFAVRIATYSGIQLVMIFQWSPKHKV
jgi:hypothetical protein